jgi:ribosomal protein S12
MAHKNANVNIALAEDTSTLARASKKDSAVMRTIAIEAKKDSSAMKTIAILGMFFLPGTFLAVSSL